MSLFKLNTISYVFYFQIVTSAIVASVLIPIGAVDFHRIVKLIPDAIRIEAWIWTMYSLIAMPLSMILINRIVNIDVKELFERYIKSPLEIHGSALNNKLFLLSITIFSGLVLAYIFYHTERIALYTLLVEHDPEQASIDRITSRLNFGGLSHVKNLLGLLLMPIFCYYTYIMMRRKKQLFYIVIFIINFFLSLLLIAHDTQKAPIAFFMIGFWIVEVFISKDLSIRKLLVFIAVPVILLLTGYVLTSDKGFDQILRFNSAFYGRTFLTNYFAFPLSLDIFPDIITEPTYAVGLPGSLADWMGLNTVESARLLKMYIDPETIQSGKGNLYSGYYMAEAWANYGYLGLIIAPFIVGLILQTVHLFLLTNPKRPLILAFYTGLSVKWVVSSGFVNFFYLKLLIWPIILYVVTNLILNLFLNKQRAVFLNKK